MGAAVKNHMSPSRFVRSSGGATAVEFALISMVFLGVLLGAIDMARFAWEFNAQKAAARAGARFAAVHPPAVTELADFHAITACSGLGFGGGENLTSGIIPDYTCTSTSCTGTAASGCGLSGAGTLSTTNFNAIVNYMKRYNPRISASNVEIKYRERGLGVAGNPFGTDVSPLITVTLTGVTFRPIALRIFGVNLPLPSVATTITAEDMS